MQNCPRMAELKEKRIFVTDFGPGEGEIELLIGSDYYTQWMTGNNFCLKNGLMVLETQFGWIVSGKLAGDHTDEHKINTNIAMQVCSMFVAEANISQMWDLEAIAIMDRADKRSRLE
jgi:Putative peptidase (DUF1758)